MVFRVRNIHIYSVLTCAPHFPHLIRYHWAPRLDVNLRGKTLSKRAPQELMLYIPCIGSTIWLLQISAWSMIRALFMSFYVWTILHICLSVCSNKCLLIIFDWWALAYKLYVSLLEIIPSRIARFGGWPHERIDTIKSTYQIVRDYQKPGVNMTCRSRHLA